MSIDYRFSHMCPGKGRSYHSSFQNSAHRSIIWALEKQILNDIMSYYFSNRHVIAHLDFACGTGRILEYLQNKVKISVGVDISSEMLGVARNNLKACRLIEADLTKNDVLRNEQFDIITAFRFFPNAQPDLRKEVIGCLVTHLKKDGLIILNNHKNASSILYRVARFLGDSRGEKGMSHAEVLALVTSVGLKIIKIYSTGFFPSNDRYLLIPKSMLYFIERSLMKRSAFPTLFQNNIYVCSL